MGSFFMISPFNDRVELKIFSKPVGGQYVMSGFRQKPLRLRNAFLASLQGLLPEPCMDNYIKPGFW